MAAAEPSPEGDVTLVHREGSQGHHSSAMLIKWPVAGFLPDSLFMGSCWLLGAPHKIGEKLLKAWRGAPRAFDAVSEAQTLHPTFWTQGD